jgi:hypothetical protein
MKIIWDNRDGVHPGCEIAPRIDRRSPQAAGHRAKEAHAYHTGKNNSSLGNAHHTGGNNSALGNAHNIEVITTRRWETLKSYR